MSNVAAELERNGATPREAAYVAGFEGGVSGFYAACADPTWLMRVAVLAGIEPKQSLAIAIEAARAVLQYVGAEEPRPRRALDVAERYLSAEIPSSQCAAAAQAAEDVARAYRDAKGATKIDRRTFRAAHHSAMAAAKAACVARDAALTRELDYDASFTFEDAWAGVRSTCAMMAASALVEAVEAACAATSAAVTIETGSSVAGQAAADEAKPAALAWAARVVHKHVDPGELARRLRT